ncbi:MerR family transcriptional regulator [Clostridioides difficile]|nr:MerR family transcriptional regulator [Clostridioides difficile]
MSKIKRLTDVWTYINDKQKFTIKELSEEFNLSTKTIQRYLTELNEMGLPIQTEKGRNGGYRVLNNSYIPPVVFTEIEVMSIFFALKSLQIYRSMLIDKEIDSIIRKISYERKSSIKEGIDNIKSYIEFIPNEGMYKSSDIVEIFRASSESCILNIKYKSGNQLHEKNVCPIGIFLKKCVWFTPVYDYESDKIILICMENVIEFKRIGNSKKKNISLKEWIDTVYMEAYENMQFAKEFDENTKLCVLLTEDGVLKLKNDSYDLDIKMNEDGSGIIDTFIKHDEIDWYVSTLFSIGQEARVVEPKFINKLLYDKAKELKYFFEENML